MAINFTQTDTNDQCARNGTYCSGLTSAGVAGNSDRCVDGGTAGTLERTFSVPGEASDQAITIFTCLVGASVSWDAGTWTVRLNVTTENMFLTWSSVHICRVNSSCTNQETIGSSSSLGIGLDTAGVKSTTVSGSAVTPSAGDKVVIVFGLSNSNMSAQSVGITVDQNIDSPFTQPDTGVAQEFTFGQTQPVLEATEIIGY